MSAKFTNPYSQGERLKKSYSLSARERREWARKILAAVETVEKADDSLTKTLSEAWEAGMSYASLGGLVSVNGTTIQKRIEDAKKDQ